MKDLNPEIWLPHFWFFMYSCAHNYPEYPNKVTKRKYYDFISNLPLFCPNEEIQKKIINYLDVFPVTAYLDTKDSFTYWVHFIHNKMNKDLAVYLLEKAQKKGADDVVVQVVKSKKSQSKFANSKISAVKTWDSSDIVLFLAHF